MQTIETRYCGPTNTKGARIIATTASGLRHVILYRDDGDHAKAATELAESLGWLADKKLVCGATRSGYCFTLVSKAPYVNHNAPESRS